VSAEAPRLDVRGLTISAAATGAELVADVSFALPRGRILGVVGESGSGKTSLALALLGFARSGMRISGGSVLIGGVDVLSLDEEALRLWRGRSVGFVPQNPARSLSPGMRVGRQIEEMIELHVPPGPDRSKMLQVALRRAHLPLDEAILARYPHQLSGGQNQRVAIAMALSLDPSVLVMDEPTTGLDVITQAYLVDVIRSLPEQQGCSIVYVSHDLGVVRSLADHVAVMKAGRIVEHAPVRNLFQRPAHAYTRTLLEAIPRLRGDMGALHSGCTGMASKETPAPSNAPLFSIHGLVAGYRKRRSLFGGRSDVTVVKGASLDIPRGGCLAIVGESGSGKTTLGRCIAGLHEPTGGEMRFDGTALPNAPHLRPPLVRKRIQIVFQDPDSSLNPSMTVARILARPLRQFFRLDRDAEGERIASLLQRVGLAPEMADRLPRALSGGQKQRVAIARALAAEPDLLICDEITSALDAVVQASMLDLLRQLQRSTGMAMLFISHELGIVRAISDRVVIMRNGTFVETGETEAIYTAPQQEYTKSLLDAAPDLGPNDYPVNTHLPSRHHGACL
jgi:peptide/nickel transport system ATP-binding protein